MTEGIILTVLLVLSGFFSGIELAYFSLPELKVQRMVKEQKPNAKLVQKLKKQPQKLLITILVGNNLVNIGAASYATVVFTSIFGDSGVGIATGVMTFLILVFGEITPKAFCNKYAEQITTLFAKPMSGLVLLMSPVSLPLSYLVQTMTGKKKEEPIVSEEEITLMAELGAKEGVVQTEEQKMITRVFTLNDITTEQAMIPIKEAFILDEDEDLFEMKEEIWDSPYSRIPLIDKSTGRITGILNKVDALKELCGDEQQDYPLSNLSRKAYFVSNKMTLDKLLQHIQMYHNHMAIVRNENNETIGLVTLEDVLEEIVGDIADETDLSEQLIHRLSRKEILVLGKTQMSNINNYFNTSFKGGITVEEFLMQNLEQLPKTGTKIHFAGVDFTIQKKVKGKPKVIRVEKHKVHDE